MRDLYIGAPVRIIRGPIDKVGKTGRVRTLAVNGAIVQFPDGSGTPVRSQNLEILPEHGPESICPIDFCGECDRISRSIEDL